MFNLCFFYLNVLIVVTHVNNRYNLLQSFQKLSFNQLEYFSGLIAFKVIESFCLQKLNFKIVNFN